jgi:hypothetical protein
VFKRLIFWDFPRTTWQYDVVVALILAFIFFTPRGVFNDQPRAPGVVRLPSTEAGGVFFIEPKLLVEAPPEAIVQQASQVVSRRLGRQASVASVQPIKSEEGELKGYMVYLKR